MFRSYLIGMKLFDDDNEQTHTLFFTFTVLNILYILFGYCKNEKKIILLFYSNIFFLTFRKKEYFF